MERDYSSGTKDGVTYFTGFEVEKTPAFDMDTLFVVGCRPLEEVLEKAKEHHVDHIYLGANQSFVPKEDWEDLVTGLLNKKYTVTLDYDVKYHDWVIEQGFNQYNNFISQISVKLPHVKELNYNACIKIDDADFNHSNTGVWSKNLKEITEHMHYTDWSEYVGDTVIDVDNEE